MPNGPAPTLPDESMASPSQVKIPNPPPGLQRSIPKPTKTGKVPFEYAPSNVKSETYYELWGELSSSSTPPLICLHGGPGIPHSYILPMALVHADHGLPVLMYDQIGCGGSTRFKDKRGDTSFWVPELFMAELDNLKAQLGITSFDLLGQSWGGMLAGLYVADKQPKGLRKLVIADSPSWIGGWVAAEKRILAAYLSKEIQDTIERCEREGAYENDAYKEAVLEFYKVSLCRTQPWPRELLESMEATEEDSTVYETMNGPSEFTVIGPLKDFDIREKLRKVTAETVPGGMLITNGFYDGAQDEVTAPFFYNTSCSSKWVRYPLSSHCPFLEESETFVRDLGWFLTS